MQLTVLEDKFLYKEVSDEEYFSEAYKDYISNSALALINPAQGGGPIRFLQGFKDADKCEALILGTAIHRMTLEKDIYELSEVDKPGGKIGDVVKMIYHLRNREDIVSLEDAFKTAFIAKDYYASKITPARIKNVIKQGLKYYMFLSKKKEEIIALTQPQKELVVNCVSSVKPFFDRKTEKDFEVFNEYPIFAQFLYWHKKLDQYVSCFLKCKIDRFEIDHKNKVVTLIDLKTTGSSVDSFLEIEYLDLNDEGTDLVKKKYLGSFYKYHYYRQMAMYKYLLEQYCTKELNLEGYKFNTEMVVVEKLRPYRAMRYVISDELIKLGEIEFEELLNIVLYYKNKGFDYIDQ